MKKLFALLIFLCALGANAATFVTANITITNTPVRTNTLTVNGDSRNWATNITNSATQFFVTNNVGWSLTNMFQQIAGHPYTGPMVATMTTASNMTLQGVANSNLTVTFGGSGWAKVSYSTNTTASAYTLTVPTTAQTNLATLTNIWSMALTALQKASNAFPASASILANFLGANSTAQNFTNKNFRSGSLDSTTITNAPFLVASNVTLTGGTATNITIKGGSLTGASTISGGLGTLTDGSIYRTFLASNLVRNPWLSGGWLGTEDDGSAVNPVQICNLDLQFRYVTIWPGLDFAGDGMTTDLNGKTTGSRIQFRDDPGNVVGWIHSDENGFPGLMYRYGGTNTYDGFTAGGIALDSILNYGTALRYFPSLAYAANYTPTNQTSYGDLQISPRSTAAINTNSVFYGATLNTTTTNNGAWTEAITTVSSLANGNNAVSVPDSATHVDFSGPSADHNFNSLTNGWTGRILLLRNASSYTTTFINESGFDSSPANRFSLPNSQDFPVAPDATLRVKYSGSRWHVIGGSALANTNAYATVSALTSGTNAAVQSKWDSVTNTFTGTTFFLGTNQVIACSTNIYLTAVGNLPTSNERYGVLTILASGGNVTVTNLGSMKTSDMTTSRVVTNGNTLVIAVDVMPGFFTNAAMAQFK